MQERGELAGTAPASPRARLDGLDALRGIAALMVALMHLEHMNGRGGLIDHGYLAVDLFFALSGYVMARTYEGRFAGGMGAADFMLVRLRRLWPTMAAGAAFGLIAFWNELPVATSLAGFALALAMIPSPGETRPSFPTNIPAWSILFELLANAIHGLILRRLPVGALIGLAAICALLLIWHGSGMDVGGQAHMQLLGTARVLVSYCTGIAIWRTVGERATLPGWIGLVLLPLGVLGPGWAGGLADWADYAFVFLACPVIVLAGLAPLRFARAPLVWLGTISFPLYAIHYPLGMWLIKAGWPLFVTLPALLAAATLVAHMTNGGWRLRAWRIPLPA